MTRFSSAPWPLKAAYVAALAVGALAAVLAVSIVVALVGLKRLSADIDLAAIPGWFWYFRGDPEVRRWAGVGLASALGLAASIVLGVGRSLRPPLYGAARWASETELTQGGLRARQGVVLGWSGGRLLTFGGTEHVMLHAPTRSGKGVGVVIPNLLTWPDSVVVLDVKRENWTATAGFRATHGQEVVLFDPLDPDGRTARFNPLGHIDRADPIAVLDELQKLAVMLFPAPHNADPFWAEAARTGLIGVGAYVAETPELSFSFGAIYAELTEGDPKTRLPAVMAACADAGRPLSAGCANALSDFCSASENTFAGVKQTITSRLGLWLNPRVCAATQASDFDLRDLRERRISLYLCVSPDNLARVAPLYGLLLQQLVDLNTRELPGDGKHSVPVLMLMDEFARLGHAAVLARSFSYVAGYGLRLLPVLQSPAQLRAEYGQDLAEEIMANCGVEIAFAPKELKVAQDLSERLGYWTYQGRSRSRPTLLSAGHRSTTESDQRRALMLPQELIQMPPSRLLVLRAGMPPARGRKVVYWRERAFARRVRPPPTVDAHPGVGAPQPKALGVPAPAKPAPRVQTKARGDMDDLTLDLVAPALEAAGLEPLPPQGASEAQVEAWVDRFIDASIKPAAQEIDHAR
ncbi:MAG: TraM recognition domain-containing protein [Phenylobacterium sp.]|uniref:type IV secretory system conjugative DNA transfer family protein n=1 Tax=Phenylobacterium sp. TaxID=1871053 RepID=UPI0025D77A07|nr:type IV secretory system conjugative DNA transfer family protein [Phenylobacterium sp.]MBI1198928.1 TraM recognition domain-containing protein [Phenylobacterium sp.]